ncbi:MAG: hypothetical protein L0271_07475 [Gemmatimonadetes bacterium]|nr:hypothetical protein [Gemmatimonadota bacterium]
MADEIVVHFKSNQRQLTATITPSGPVKGFFFLTTDKATNDRIAKLGLAREQKTWIPGVTVREGNKEVTLSADDPGPGVCYWVGNQLICW